MLAWQARGGLCLCHRLAGPSARRRACRASSWATSSMVATMAAVLSLRLVFDEDGMPAEVCQPGLAPTVWRREP